MDEAIGLSFNNVTLDGFADTINISTEGKQWWIGSIALNGETRYSLTKEEKETLQNTGNFEKECDWLTVKCESHKITLAAKPNPGKARTFSITVETEYYTDTIAGKQNMIKIGQWPDQIKLSADSLEHSRNRHRRRHTSSKLRGAHGLRLRTLFQQDDRMADRKA